MLSLNVTLELPLITREVFVCKYIAPPHVSLSNSRFSLPDIAELLLNVILFPLSIMTALSSKYAAPPFLAVLLLNKAKDFCSNSIME